MKNQVRLPVTQSNQKEKMRNITSLLQIVYDIGTKISNSGTTIGSPKRAGNHMILKNRTEPKRV